jgi:hypothetical protein
MILIFSQILECIGMSTLLYYSTQGPMLLKIVLCVVK